MGKREAGGGGAQLNLSEMKGGGTIKTQMAKLKI